MTDAKRLAAYDALADRWLAELDKNPVFLPDDMVRELVAIRHTAFPFDEDPEESSQFE